MDKTHQTMLDHPSLDGERTAIAFRLLATMARAFAAELGAANSHYLWFVETANWLMARAEQLCRPGCPAVAGSSPAVGLRLVL